MTQWTEGYVAEIGYTYGYYGELNPEAARIPFLREGLSLPKIRNACELGFGQGLSINLHAAASDVTWWGTDFNPSQAAFAQSLQGISGASANLYDQSFEEFCSRQDLPDFELIVLHGIWSWVSDQNREVIVDFIRRKLKVGGVLYISYNTQPGWAAMIPLRDLLNQHVDVEGIPSDGLTNKIDKAMQFASQLLDVNPIFGTDNQKIRERLDRIKGQDRHYLAHEYFNRDWHPMGFRQMAELLAVAKLEYAGSAFALDHIDALNLTAEQQQFLSQITDRMFQQTVRDFCVNQQFRRDYWVRGTIKLDPLTQAEQMQNQRVLLIKSRPDVSLKVKVVVGEASLQEAVYAPILDALADHQPKRLIDLYTALDNQEFRFAQLVEAVMVLIGIGALLPVKAAPPSDAVRSRCVNLNKHICQLSRGRTDIGYLASPITGGGFGVSRFEQLFLLGIHAGGKTPREWAEVAWKPMAMQGQRLAKNGTQLETAAENISELEIIATGFAEKRLPILKSLGIV